MKNYSISFFIIIIILFQNILTKDDSFIDKRRYPNRKSIKDLQPNFQPIEQIIGNAVHIVAINFVWSTQQPTLKKGECPTDEYSYNGLCYKLVSDIINVTKTYTDSEVIVIGIFYGVPVWTRRSCSVAVDPIFCALTKEGAVYYGLFVKFIVHFFNGENGNGRVADFVIHNEVNCVDWFNYGVDNGHCDIDLWTSVYAQSYNEAYNNVILEQKSAKILISFLHDFFSDLDHKRKYTHSTISCKTFLKYLIPKIRNRKWRLANHAYPIDLLKPEFSPDDYPFVTFRNIGAISGWLHKNYQITLMHGK